MYNIIYIKIITLIIIAPPAMKYCELNEWEIEERV